MEEVLHEYDANAGNGSKTPMDDKFVAVIEDGDEMCKDIKQYGRIIG